MLCSEKIKLLSSIIHIKHNWFPSGCSGFLILINTFDYNLPDVISKDNLWLQLSYHICNAWALETVSYDSKICTFFSDIYFEKKWKENVLSLEILLCSVFSTAAIGIINNNEYYESLMYKLYKFCDQMCFLFEEFYTN